MEDFIRKLQNKSVHIVGVTGAEGSSILRFLVKHNLTKITVHDFIKEEEIEKSFRLWHKGVNPSEKEKLLQHFKSDLSLVKQNFGANYLRDIETADFIFIPQSWRLYKGQNQKLFDFAGKIPFYSLTRLYLDFAPAKIIAVTGTVGKGSTANLIYQLVKKSLPANRRVYFAGNETWMIQLADRLDQMKENDLLILEISHRQLQDGFSRAPQIVVITNLYPNHLDETDWETYQNLKLSLLYGQKPSDTSVLNYDVPQLRLKNKLKTKVLYFSEKTLTMNTNNVQKIYEKVMSKKSNHFPVNLLAAFTVVDSLGINIEQSIDYLEELEILPARLEFISDIGGVDFYDDIKSTTPWATLAAINKLGQKTLLICGGKTKGIDYRNFADLVKEKTAFVIAVKSELSEKLKTLLSPEKYRVADNLQEALDFAYAKAQKGDHILISPAAAFFYSDFVRGKSSIRKLIGELN